MLQKIIVILQQNNAINHTSITNTSLYVVEKRPETQFAFNKLDRFKLEASNQLSTQTIEKINKQLAQAAIPAVLLQKLGVGQKAKTYAGLKKVFAEQDSSIQHKQGEVLLVDVWATWCGPCQKPMQHNQEMLSKNDQKWKDKVRIVAVSVDQQKDTIKERINSKGWNKMQHLTLLGWDGQHPLVKDFQIQGIPFVFLVDKSGTIAYVGHPSQVNLQQKINELIQKAEEVKVNTQQKEQSNQKLNVDFADLQKLLNQQILKEKFGKAQLFSIRVKVLVTITNGNLNKNIQVELATYEDTPQVVNQFKNYFNFQGAVIKQNLVKYQVSPTADNISCIQCKKQLTYPFYWCKWEQNPNTFRCRQCIQKKPQQKQNFYNYLKNSVLITAPWKRISTKGLGNNIQPQKISEIKNPNQFGCNGCGVCPQDIGVARYVCLACRSDPNYRGDNVDFCQECLSEYLKKNQEKVKEMDVQGHNSSHPLLRILFNVKGYYDF